MPSLIRTVITRLCSGICAALVLAGSASADDPSPFPPAPVPMEFGEVSGPNIEDFNTDSWQARGAWLDDNTVASGVIAPGKVVIATPVGFVLEVISNPDAVGEESFKFGCAVEYIDGKLLILSWTDATWGPPILNVFERPRAGAPFARVARVPLPGAAYFNSAETARIVLENVSGTLANRKLLITWINAGQLHVTVLTPTVGRTQWTIHQGLQFVGNARAPAGSVRGDLVACLIEVSSPLMRKIVAFRPGVGEQLVPAGEWMVAGGTGPTQLSAPAVLGAHEIAVGQSNWQNQGGVHLVSDTNGSWQIAETLVADEFALNGSWGRAIGACDDHLVVARSDALDDGTLGNIMFRNSGGEWKYGARLSDPTLITQTTLFVLMTRVHVTETGDVLLHSAGQSTSPATVPTPTWNWARLHSAFDLDQDGISDAIAIDSGKVADCNQNGVPDAADIAMGLVPDLDRNGLPDTCQSDCDGDGIYDYAAILAGAIDCDSNGVPDSCQLAAGAPDADDDGMLDTCGIDCNGNGIADSAELAQGMLEDCDNNGIADTCEAYQPLPLHPSAATNSSVNFFWFPIAPGKEVIRTIDAPLFPSTPPFIVDIIRDQSGIADRSSVTEEDVIFHMVTSLPAIPPVGPDGMRPPVRINLGAVDCSGTAAIWVRVNGVQFRTSEVQPVTPTMQGAATSVSGLQPTYSPAQIADRFANNGTPNAFSSSAVLLNAVECYAPGDLNMDGRVDGVDLGMLLGSWGCIYCGPADIDRNGVVAGGDLGILLGDWTP